MKPDFYPIPDFLRNQENLAKERAAKERLILASQNPVSFESRVWCQAHRLYLSVNCPTCNCNAIPSAETQRDATMQEPQ